MFDISPILEPCIRKPVFENTARYDVKTRCMPHKLLNRLSISVSESAEGFYEVFTNITKLCSQTFLAVNIYFLPSINNLNTI